MIRVGKLCALWLGLAACSGVAVIDGSGDSSGTDDDGATSQGGNGREPSCSSRDACCNAVCGYAPTLPCWNEDDRCDCGGDNATPECDEAWITWAHCLLPQIEDAVVCRPGAGEDDVVLACGFCDAELAAVRSICDVEAKCG